MKSFEYVTETAMTDRGLCNRDKVSFHYFNPNGLYARWRSVCDRISGAVNAGKVPFGWIIAYGSFNHYAVDRFTALADKRRVRRIALEVALDGLRRDIETAEGKLASLEE